MAVNTTVQVTMPAMGESVTEGTVLEWHKKEGDPVDLDEVLVEISTDKVDAEVPAPASGTLTEILFDEGDTVTVGQVIARMQIGAGHTPPKAVGPAAKAAAPSTGNGAPAKAEPVQAAPAPDGTKV